MQATATGAYHGKDCTYYATEIIQRIGLERMLHVTVAIVSALNTPGTLPALAKAMDFVRVLVKQHPTGMRTHTIM